jgi:hypothetical protein
MEDKMKVVVATGTSRPLTEEAWLGVPLVIEFVGCI